MKTLLISLCLWALIATTPSYAEDQKQDDGFVFNTIPLGITYQEFEKLAANKNWSVMRTPNKTFGNCETYALSESGYNPTGFLPFASLPSGVHPNFIFVKIKNVQRLRTIEFLVRRGRDTESLSMSLTKTYGVPQVGKDLDTLTWFVGSKHQTAVGILTPPMASGYNIVDILDCDLTQVAINQQTELDNAQLQKQIQAAPSL